MGVCTCFAVESSADFCDCGCDYCAEYCLPPEPDFDDEMDFDDDSDPCIHIAASEQAGGWMMCDFCGSDVTAEFHRKEK